mmetsp:Transcript_25674/g.67375  ORF Transcript_25674/g.67375 Transcript_25674/m.67375 type:complete len:206 (+) Transcript_25674:124-741(+)
MSPPSIIPGQHVAVRARGSRGGPRRAAGAGGTVVTLKYTAYVCSSVSDSRIIRTVPSAVVAAKTTAGSPAAGVVGVTHRATAPGGPASPKKPEDCSRSVAVPLPTSPARMCGPNAIAATVPNSGLVSRIGTARASIPKVAATVVGELAAIWRKEPGMALLPATVVRSGTAHSGIRSTTFQPATAWATPGAVDTFTVTSTRESAAA